MATQDSPNLYERLGGVYSIATVVDDLIDRVMADQRLNANPLVDEAHHKVPPAGFKYLVTEMLCWAAGGPQKYTGKDMLGSHRHLRITPGEWDAFMDDVTQTLDKFALPPTERAEVVAIVESTRADIVVSRRSRVEKSGFGTFATCQPHRAMSAVRGNPEDICSDRVLPTLTHLYGPAVRCKPNVNKWRGLVLRICIRPLHGAFVLLAIMDIRAHPISFSERP